MGVIYAVKGISTIHAFYGINTQYAVSGISVHSPHFARRIGLLFEPSFMLNRESTSSAMSSVVLMHQVLAHHTSPVKSNRECVGHRGHASSIFRKLLENKDLATPF